MPVLAASTAAFKLKNPRKGTETNVFPHRKPSQVAFKLKNPRKGTETAFSGGRCWHNLAFKLKNPRKGTETAGDEAELAEMVIIFQIKESPEGD